MWLPVRVERLIEAIVGRLEAIQEALHEHNRSEDAASIGQQNALASIGRQLSEIRSDDEYKRSANTYKHKSYRLQVWLNILTALAFVAAAIYAGISYWQLKLMGDQMRLEQRAWIGLQGVDGVPEVNKPFIVTTHYLNTGKTPAVRVVMQVRGRPFSKGENFFPDWSDSGEPVVSGGRAVNNLLPNQELSQHVPFNVVGVGQDAIDKIKENETVIYVYGRVCYRDIFNQPHWVRFCQFYNPPSNSFAGCPTYNEIDDMTNGTEETCAMKNDGR